VGAPFLHDLVTCVHAPTVALSGMDGQIRPGGIEGVLRHDRRILSELVVDVDGREPVSVGHTIIDARTARFVGVVRHLGGDGADPQVRLERERRVSADGITERLTLANASRSAITATVRVRIASDFATMNALRRGEQTAPVPPVTTGHGTTVWADDHDRVTVRVEEVDPSDSMAAVASTSVPSGPVPTLQPDGAAVFTWAITVPARAAWTARVALQTEPLVDVTGEQPRDTAFFLAADGPGWDTVTVTGPTDLSRLITRSVDDLRALTLADPAAPEDVFFAAGSPWYFTLFGRDSLWAARFTLPLGTDLARGTLRTLARRQGTVHDITTAEAPGKILHEVRTASVKLSDQGSLPPVYFGTIDATALWISLLHDAWRWGMARDDVAALLDPLRAALDWLLRYADSDGDGLLEYLDETGQGLANQGWKDSGDSIQFPDGRIATAPIALSEAQAYAHEAALDGAALLDAFGLDGGDELREWARALRERFRMTFWVTDARGRFPALALDGSKAPVGTATSNLGHLLATGLLDPQEAADVAARIGQPDLDSGYGLRTMSSDAAGFHPLGYHAGSVWPHDTAIAILGLVREGHTAQAAALATGLVRAAPEFAFRLPELFAGTDGRTGQPVLAYPASCRPQAWSAAAAIALLQAALGLEVDVPAGELRVAPAPEFSAWFPLRVTGLRVAGHPLTVEVDAAGKAKVETTAPVLVKVE
jgi:glycogen debranching enzyme